MHELNDNYISIGRAAQELDLSTQTLTRWYKWWECPDFDHPKELVLPPYLYKDRRKTKYFKKEDLAVLVVFRDKIQNTHRGIMAEFNAAYQWGRRGDNVLGRKGMTVKDVRRKMR